VSGTVPRASQVRVVADLLLAHPEYGRISIEGHSNYQGPEESNQRLSATGYGTSHPLVPGRSIAANRQNRRIEFVITRTISP
jgi:outer membrane protein OmpA-like peptidoglycan-associated protein